MELHARFMIFTGDSAAKNLWKKTRLLAKIGRFTPKTNIVIDGNGGPKSIIKT